MFYLGSLDDQKNDFDLEFCKVLFAYRDTVQQVGSDAGVV